VAALRAFALVERETIPDERDLAITTECIRLHRLVRQVAAARAAGAAQEDMLRALIEAMAVVYPAKIYDDANSWPRARRLDALTLVLVGGKTEPPEGAQEGCAYLLNQLGSYRLALLLPAQGDYAGARQLCERALAIREKVLGAEHSLTAAGSTPTPLLHHRCNNVTIA
jgi:Tetratricopeptide repeat